MQRNTRLSVRSNALVLSTFVAAIAAVACESKSVGPPPPDASAQVAAPTTPGVPTLDDAKNATYSGLAGPTASVTLKEGRWESTANRQTIAFVGDMIATGDLDGDGIADAAVALGENTGGSGDQVYLAVISKGAGAAKNVATTALGPNIKLRKMQIVDRTIRVDVLQVGSDDPMCCPSDLATRTFTLQGSALQEQPVMHTGKLTPDAMAGTEWVLRRLSTDEHAPAEPKITLTFDGGRFVGSSGCNRYTAAVTPGDQAGAINVSQSASTRMACPEPAMTLESKYLKLLGGVTHYTFFGGQLALIYQADSTINTMLFDPADHQ